MNFLSTKRCFTLRRMISAGKLFRISLALALFVTMGLCACGKGDAPEPEPTDEADLRTVCAVMFFQNQEPNPETDWIGRGIAQLLSLRLSQHDQLAVVRHARLEAVLRIMGQQNAGQPADQFLRQAAGRVEAARAVLGDYLIDDGRLTINTRLVDVSDGTVLAEGQVQGAGLPDLFRLASEIAEMLENGLDLDIDPSPADIRPTEDVAAYQDFIEGLEAFRRFDMPAGMARLGKAISRDGDFSLAYAVKAIQAYSIGDLPRAIAAVSHARSRPERLPETERLITDAIGENLIGNYDPSFDTFQRLRKRIKPDPETNLVLAQMYYSIRDYASAETIYQDLLRQDPENVTAHIMLGLNQLELGLTDLAQSHVEEALRLKADHPYAYIIMSRVAVFQKDLEGAEDHLRQASRLDPEDPWIHNQLGYFYLSRNKTELALQEFQRYAELAPDDPNAHDSLAEGYLRTGKQDLAEKEYLLALKLKPDFDNPHFMLGWIYQDRGETQKAIRMLRGYLRLSPRGPRAKEAEARLEALSG